MQKDFDKCDVCPLARQTRLPFPNSENRSSCIFDLLHLDVWGPFHVPTFDGYRMFLTIVNDHFRMTWIFLLKLKSDVVVVLRNFFQLVSTQFGKRVKVLRQIMALNLSTLIVMLCLHLLVLYIRKHVFTHHNKMGWWRGNTDIF